MKKQQSQYDNNTMKILKGADRVRLKPSVIFGSDDINGAKQSLFEILSNSIDESKEGFGKEITIIKDKKGAFTIIDNGRGLPLDWNEKQNCYNYHIALCELYGGGKYDGAYTSGSLGTNGLGLASTQMASEYMEVTSFRDGYKYFIRCEKGYPIIELEKTKLTNDKTGTIICYKPDKEVFTDTDIPSDWIKEMLEKQSIITPSVKFTFKDENNNENFEYFYENGIVDYLKNKIEQPLHDIVSFTGEGKGKDTEDRAVYEFRYHLAFCFTGNENIQMTFHNNGELIHGGSTLNAVRNAFLFSVNKLIKDNNKFQKNEKKVNIEDILDGFSFICNSFSTFTSYSNQTKTSINNKFIQDCLTKNLKHQLEVYFTENPKIAQKIINQVLINMRSRTRAETTRLNIKKKLGEHPTLTNKVKKFIDCRLKDKDVIEIYIVEGDSAAGSCKLGRNADFQTIFPIRGKILNCLKADEEKIFKSEVILDLFKILGCGIQIKSKHNKDLNIFDIDKLRFSKIIICTDADVDGFQIRTLILTVFYVLAPQLIKEKKVFIAETPLYEIAINDKTYFAYSDEEKMHILKTYSTKSSKIHIQRSKGLGENTPEMMWETTMNPETRHLICVTENHPDIMKDTFDLLLGDNLKDRKTYIEQYGKDFLVLD